MKTYTRRAAFILAVGVCLGVPPAAEAALDQHRESSDTGVVRALEINRSMLARFERELASLSEASSRTPSPETERRLSGIHYKIKALSEENEKLSRALPPRDQAGEFLNDVIARHSRVRETPSAAPSDLPSSEPEPHGTPRPPEAQTAAAPSLLLDPVTDLTAPAPHGEALGQPSRSEATVALHERALEYVARKELDKASKLYEEIVLIDSNDDEAYVILGHTYLMTGRYEKAEAAFQNAAHIDRENLRQIAPFYENIVLQNPGSDEAFKNLGYAYLILGDFGRAKLALEDALKLNPENLDAQEGLGILGRATSSPGPEPAAAT